MAGATQNTWMPASQRCRKCSALANSAHTTAVILVLVAVASVQAQRVVSTLTPELIGEAIRAGERGSLPSGELMEKSGWSWGSLHIATFSTPFMRVATAAGQARRQSRTFTAGDVTAAMTAPELHVHAWAAVDGMNVANVSEVFITPKKGSQTAKLAKAIRPERIESVPQPVSSLVGATTQVTGRLAVFPLSALSEDNEVHVVYDRQTSIGVTAAAVKCADCKAAFSLKGVR